MAQSDIAGFNASHGRFLDARRAGKEPKLPKYFWRPPEVDVAIDACMADHGRRNCSRRDYVGLNDDGLPELWAVIVDAKGETIAAFDVSHPCPPFCEGFTT